MDFLEFCQARGVLIDALPPIGLWKRYRTSDKDNTHRNGAVKWMGNHGFVQNHATMLQVDTWHSDDNKPYIQSAEDKARIDAARARERQRRIDGMMGARALWARSKRLLGGHPYLTRKGLTMQGCTGLRVTQDERLLIPMHQGEVLMSVQSIDNEGSKLFFPGAPTQGCYYSILRQRAAVTAVCEGFATGLCIFQAIPQANVVVAFNAGNLLPVAKNLKLTGSVVFCADNDHATLAKRGFNPGLDAARNAAEFIGAGVAYPEGIEGSDWADCLKEHGAGGHKFVAREVLKHARYVAA